MKPNSVLYAVIGVAGLGALAGVVIAAEMHGKRRQVKRAFLVERHDGRPR